MKPWTNIGVKVVERAGQRIEDILHKSDPWEKRDCERENCALCITSVENEKIPFANCTKRSVIYMTWCESCRLERLKQNGENLCTENKSEKERGSNREKKRKCVIDKKENFVYIGETAKISDTKMISISRMD